MIAYHVIGHKNDPESKVHTPDLMRAFIGGGIFNEGNGRFHHTIESDAYVIILTLEGKAYGHFEIAGTSEISKEDRESFTKVEYVYLVTRSAVYANPVKIEELGSHMGHEGVLLTEEQFQKLLAKAGELKTRPSSYRYSLLQDRPQRPWMEKAERVSPEKGTYVADNKFGHEEWLFRDEWLIDGKRYGFVEPVHKHHNACKGKLFCLKLFTKTPEGAFYVGCIKKVYVPLDEELAEAVATMEAEGWVDQMRKEIDAIGGNGDSLTTAHPELILNISFDPADVELEDGMPKIALGSTPLSTNHYVLIRDDGLPFLTSNEKPSKGRLSLDRRKEFQYRRAAQQGTLVDLVHADVQNRMYDWLCERYGDEAVEFEADWVDLRVNLPGETTFYEIKTNATAKKCIRHAIGQLFEYAMYPDASKADRLVVVGLAPVLPEDRAYMQNLRTTLNLELFYANVDKTTGCLGELQ